MISAAVSAASCACPDLFLFMAALVIGLVYAWKKGALEW